MIKRWRMVVVVVLACVYALCQVPPAWKKVVDAPGGRDYATYHYAVAQAVSGGDPYATSVLSKRASVDGYRHRVHPFLYPPPFLLSMLWAVPFSMPVAYQLFFWLNQVMLIGVLFCLRRWIGVSTVALGAIVVSCGPILETAKMGQANLLVLLLVCMGLWRSRGAWIAAAVMSKMSPALFVAMWMSQRRYRQVVSTVFGVGVLSILALLLVGVADQWRFYTQILPGFSTGQYHGLTVPISIPGNHSISDLFDQLWPGVDAHTLSERSRTAAAAMTLSSLGVLMWFSRTRRDVLGQACLAGAFTALMVLAPVYTFEHHLVFMVLPSAALAASFEQRRLPRWSMPLVIASYVGVACPLGWLRLVSREVPWAYWWLQESKCFGTMALGVFCLWAALRSPSLSRRD